MFMELLDFTDKMMTKANVTYFLFGGTLLGAFRFGRFFYEMFPRYFVYVPFHAMPSLNPDPIGEKYIKISYYCLQFQDMEEVTLRARNF